MIRQGYEDIKEYSVATAYAQEALAGPGSSFIRLP